MSRLMNKAGWIVAGVLGIAVVASIAGVVFGGPLDPPGPPGSTQRTLIFQPANCAAFPITISTPGSYVLGQNITMPVACAKNGIEISAGNVTLDLGGFELRDTDVGLKGILVPGAFWNLSIRNGTVSAWGSHAIDATSSANSQFEDLRLQTNGGDGLKLDGGNPGHIVSRVIAIANGGSGIRGLYGTVITDCVASLNSGAGIIVGGGAIVRDCSALDNGGNGIAVSSLGSSYGTLIENNSVADNTVNGISVFGDGGTIRGNTVSNNSGIGIYVGGNGNRIDENNVDSSGAAGITVDAVASHANLIMRNTSNFNIGVPYSIGAGNQQTGNGTLTTRTNPWDNIND